MFNSYIKLLKKIDTGIECTDNDNICGKHVFRGADKDYDLIPSIGRDATIKDEISEVCSGEDHVYEASEILFKREYAGIDGDLYLDHLFLLSALTEKNVLTNLLKSGIEYEPKDKKT